MYKELPSNREDRHMSDLIKSELDLNLGLGISKIRLISSKKNCYKFKITTYKNKAYYLYIYGHIQEFNRENAILRSRRIQYTKMVPKLISSGKLVIKKPTPYILVSSIDGQELSEMVPHMISAEELYTALCRFHNINVSSGHDSFKLKLTRWDIRQKNARLDDSNEEYALTVNHLLDNIVSPKRLSFVHGDPHPENIIIDAEKKRINGFVDFACSLFGDPLQDFTLIYMLSRVFQQDGMFKLYRLYRSVWDIYSKNNNIPKANFQLYYLNYLRTRFIDNPHYPILKERYLKNAKS